jgi:hypothetical protein
MRQRVLQEPLITLEAQGKMRGKCLRSCFGKRANRSRSIRRWSDRSI